jgi:cytidylate kinase
MLVTIDGPAGSGKSTVAKRLARHLKIPYIDTGAMYRSVALFAKRSSISLEDVDALVNLATPLEFQFVSEENEFRIRVIKTNAEVEEFSSEIRTPEIALAASKIAQWGPLRAVLVRKQQEVGRQSGGVLEGRDAGTVIFPEAQFKFFLTANAEVRAQRRHEEFQRKMGSQAPSFQQVLDEVNLRDRQDRERKASPLSPAPNAAIIDTSGLAEDEVFAILLQQIQGSDLDLKLQS